MKGSPLLRIFTGMQNDRCTHPSHLSHWPQLRMKTKGFLLQSGLALLHMMHLLFSGSSSSESELNKSSLKTLSCFEFFAADTPDVLATCES